MQPPQPGGTILGNEVRSTHFTLPPRERSARAPVNLLYLAGGMSSLLDSVSQRRALEDLTPDWIELRTTLVAAEDPDSLRLQTAFHIRWLPSLVVFYPWSDLSNEPLNPPSTLPAYCVVDDVAMLQGLATSGSQVSNLLQMFAGATAKELETTLRTRRFRMLVWQASARSGVPIAYLQNLNARFGSGAGQLQLSFDDRGWPTEPD